MQTTVSQKSRSGSKLRIPHSGIRWRDRSWVESWYYRMTRLSWKQKSPVHDLITILLGLKHSQLWNVRSIDYMKIQERFVFADRGHCNVQSKQNSTFVIFRSRDPNIMTWVQYWANVWRRRHPVPNSVFGRQEREGGRFWRRGQRPVRPKSKAGCFAEQNGGQWVTERWWGTWGQICLLNGSQDSQRLRGRWPSCRKTSSSLASGPENETSRSRSLQNW